MRKSVLTVFLILSLLACACSSSGGEKDLLQQDTTVVSDVENPMTSLYRERDDKVPALDLGGRVIRFISMESDADSGQLYDDEICIETSYTIFQSLTSTKRTFVQFDINTMMSKFQ